MSKKTEALEIILGLMPNAKFIDKNGKDVTEDVKKSHNTEENKPKTHKSLTEQWKKGELEQGWYYVKNEFGNIFISEYSKDYDFIGERVISGFFTEVSEITEIICEVPSYEEWQTQKECLLGVMEANKVLSRKYNNIKVNGNYPDRISKLKSRIKGLTEELEPFTDPYFRGLTTKDIAELAKKSIRLTTQHCKDNEEIEILREQLDLKNDMVDKLIRENESLKKWCEEFNALDVAEENQQLKTLLKEWMHFYPIILYEHEDTLKTKDIVELYDKTREVLK